MAMNVRLVEGGPRRVLIEITPQDDAVLELSDPSCLEEFKPLEVAITGANSTENHGYVFLARELCKELPEECSETLKLLEKLERGEFNTLTKDENELLAHLEIRRQDTLDRFIKIVKSQPSCDAETFYFNLGCGLGAYYRYIDRETHKWLHETQCVEDADKERAWEERRIKNFRLGLGVDAGHQKELYKEQELVTL